MFLLSVRADKRRLIPILLCVALAAAILIASLLFPVSRTMIREVAVETDEEGAAYLQSCGYAVALPAAEVRELCLPDTFDGALADYEALQQQAGFSLAAYAGQQVLCRTYAVVEQEQRTGDAIHLYTYRGTLIGGDLAFADGSLAALPLPSPDERT